MWTNETIFSLGDLSFGDDQLYTDFIQREYNGDYSERLYHIERAIARLQFEKRKLIEKGVSDESTNQSR